MTIATAGKKGLLRPVHGSVSRIAALLIPLGTSGCLFFADPPTSIKLLEPEPQAEFVSPLADSIVNGQYEVEVSLISNLEVSGELFIDGASVADGKGESLTYSWDTLPLSRGNHDLVVVVTDEVDREAEIPITVKVDQIPTIEISDPSEGDMLEGDVQVDFEVEDDGDVEGVALLLGDQGVADDPDSPFSLGFNTCDIDSGSHTLRIEATDDIGNVGATEIQVDTQRPMLVEITRSSSKTEPDDQLSATVAWDAGVVRVWFELDGQELVSWNKPEGSLCNEGCEDRCRFFSDDWDTSDLDEGSYPLEAFLEDAAGRTISDEVTVTVDYDIDGDGEDHEGYGGDDCDDDDDDVYPGAPEICNNIDDDCDHQVDEGFDLDGDGFAGGPTCPADSWVDCDDANPAVNPDENEICGDGIDNDCSGPDDTCRESGTYDADALSYASFNGVTNDDYIGMTIGPAGDVDGDGWGELLLGSIYMDSVQDDAGFSGGVYVVRADIAGDQSLADALALIEGTNSETAFGSAAVGVGDPNGDGFGDIAIGEPFYGDGRVYVFQGPFVGNLGPSDAEAILSWSSSEAVGFSLAPSDFDNDGDMDLAVGSCQLGFDNIAIFLGPLGGNDSSPNVLLDDDNQGAAGCSMSMVHDTDGDGQDDLLIGAPVDDTESEDAGAAWLITDNPPPSGDLDNAATALITGSGSSSQMGWVVDDTGDVNGDGYGDLLLGAGLYGSTGYGRAWLLHGPFSGEVSVADAETTFGGDDVDALGRDLVGLDFDGDGFSDLALGSPDHPDNEYSGVVSLFYGPPASGSVDAPDDADLEINGESASDWLGNGLTSAGNIDGQGGADLLASSPGSGTNDKGTVYLFLGVEGY